MSIEEEFFAKGRPIEGGFQAWLEKKHPGETFPTAELVRLRAFFFEGARVSLAGLMSSNPARDSMEVFVAIERELLAFYGVGTFGVYGHE
jgi:hypothetical protein